MTEIDLDWCICGKKTDLGQLYCSTTCASHDSTTHHNFYPSSTFSTPSSSPTSSSHNYRSSPSPPLSPLLNANYVTPPTSYSLGGFQNRSYRGSVNIHAFARSEPNTTSGD
ncbi:hypothetical protein BJ742DRAFT_493091 [Cladochytrium replicatum]|nr:hypothetical protein BJ742DRAFT_493091 [Cladochytrium replicatum]